MRPIKLLRLLVGLLLPLPLWADSLNEGYSPSGKIHFEVRHNTKEIWLSPVDHKEKAARLCGIGEGAELEIHFSPDDRWVIVQNGGGSLGVGLTLFQRVGGVDFKEMKDVDINGKAERMALRQKGLSVDPKDDLEHLYVRVLDWSADSQFVLIRLSGRGNNGKYHVAINGWNALFSPETGQFTFDLNQTNARAVVKTQR